MVRLAQATLHIGDSAPNHFRYASTPRALKTRLLVVAAQLVCAQFGRSENSVTVETSRLKGSRMEKWLETPIDRVVFHPNPTKNAPTSVCSERRSCRSGPRLKESIETARNGTLHPNGTSAGYSRT